MPLSRRRLGKGGSADRLAVGLQGLRTCLGMQLARMNVPCAVAKFVSAFRLELTPEVCSLLVPTLPAYKVRVIKSTGRAGAMLLIAQSMLWVFYSEEEMNSANGLRAGCCQEPGGAGMPEGHATAQGWHPHDLQDKGQGRIGAHELVALW